MIQLNPHQQDAYNNIVSEIVKGDGNSIGRIVIPTGGGKTYGQ